MGFDQFIESLYWRIFAKPHVPMTPAQLGALVLRDGTPADLPKLAQLHVDTYNESHVGPFGSGPTYSLRESQWREKLDSLHATNFVMVIETPARELVGFAWVHPVLGENFGSRLNKIYIRRSHQRQGLGRALVASAVHRLLSNGVDSMMLFTETDNVPACSFYEKLGGERQLGDDGKFHGKYAWPNLRALQERLRS